MPHVSPRYTYHRPAELDRPGARHPVVVVGGGLVGLTIALDLARRGIPSVLLDEDDTAATGSRAICFSKRTLEIFARLGIGERLLEKGITWHLGKVFFQNRQIYAFDLLPETGHRYPAFVNLQQYYVEEWLAEACAASGLVDLRWRNRVLGVENAPDGARLDVETPDGRYELRADWLLACDGAHSTVRRSLGLDFTGRVFNDRFLIADVVMQAEFPTERWFWFDPPFHPGQSVLLHKQPDNVWRIDFQLGRDADPELEKQPRRVIPRVQAMLGNDVPFTLEWVSVYSFRCRRMDKFVHGRTIFLGDAAHQVSPFGARGGNAGVQDADNLGWKLAALLHGKADRALIESYDAERIPANDENILHSTRSTDFITPKSDAARAYRDAVLLLAERFAFARPLVNSGRLSRAASLATSPLTTPGDAGGAATDAPIIRDGIAGWLLDAIAGNDFVLLCFGDPAHFAPVREARLVVIEPDGVAAERYGASEGTCILLRPDQHIAARFPAFDPHRIAAAIDRALAREMALA